VVGEVKRWMTDIKSGDSRFSQYKSEAPSLPLGFSLSWGKYFEATYRIILPGSDGCSRGQRLSILHRMRRLLGRLR
jgi:hypothetical protein